MNQNFLHKDREAIQTPVVHVRKRLQHYVTNFIDAIPSAISDFITEQRISAIDFNPLFSLLKMTTSPLFSASYITLSFPR